MSALKLSATASIYVRSATAKSKTKPLFILYTNSNRTTHEHGRRYMPTLPPCTNRIPVPVPVAGFTMLRKSKIPSVFDKLVLSGRALCSAVPQPQSQPEQDPSKLLTLPTILTLGRVAAVPLLVASTTSSSIYSAHLFALHFYYFW